MMLNKFRQLVSHPKRSSTISLLLIVLFGTLLVSISLFSSEYSTGPDFFFYLIQIKKITEGGLHEVFAIYPDRIMTFLSQTIFTIFPFVNEVVSLKIGLVFATLFQITFFYLLTREMFDKKLGLLSAFYLVLSSAFYRISWDMYANFHATLVFILILGVYFLKKNINKYLKASFLGLLSGLLVYFHNFSAVTFLGIIFLPFVIFNFLRNIPKEKNKIGSHLKLGSVYLIIFVLVSSWSFEKWLFPAITDVLGTFLNRFLGYEFTASYVWPTDIYHLETIVPKFPYNSQVFSLFLPSGLLLIGLAGLVILLTKRNKTNSERFVKWWTLGLFVLTQQQIFGFNWLSERNVLLLAWPLAICGAIFTVSIRKYLLKFTRDRILAQIILTISLTLLLIKPLELLLTSVNFMRATNAYLTEINFLKKVNQMVDKKGVVVTSNVRQYKSVYLLDNTLVQTGEYYLICGNKKVESVIDEEQAQHSYYLSQELDAGTVYRQAKMEEEAKNVSLYFIIGPDDYCVDKEKFNDQRYFNLVYEDYLRLYSLKE